MYFDDKVGVLGHESIRSRLKSLGDFGIHLTPAEILQLPFIERPSGLKLAQESGFIIVDPPYTQEELSQTGGNKLGNCSLDLELGDILRVTHFPEWEDGAEQIPEDLVIDLADPSSFTKAEAYDLIYQLDPERKYRLEPGAFVRAYTQRYFFMPYDLVGWVKGRSKLARIGVTATVDAPKIDPGFSGRIVLEIAHLGRIPLQLSVGVNISQMIFFTVEGKIGTPYDALHDDVSFDRQEGIHYACAPIRFDGPRRVVGKGIQPLTMVDEEQV